MYGCSGEGCLAGRTGGERLPKGVPTIDRLKGEVTNHRAGAWYQQLVVVEERQRSLRVGYDGRSLQEVDREGDRLCLVLGGCAVAVALWIPDGLDSAPERGQLSRGAELPAMPQLVRQGMTQLRGSHH